MRVRGGAAAKLLRVRAKPPNSPLGIEEGGVQVDTDCQTTVLYLRPVTPWFCAQYRAPQNGCGKPTPPSSPPAHVRTHRRRTQLAECCAEQVRWAMLCPLRQGGGVRVPSTSMFEASRGHHPRVYYVLPCPSRQPSCSTQRCDRGAEYCDPCSCNIALPILIRAPSLGGVA